MNKHIQKFLIDFKERMSRNYYDNLLYFTPYVPNPLINFNNVLLLKQGQKYIHHTENLFQKSISYFFCELFKDAKVKAKICMTDGGNGRGVIAKINGATTRFHFLGQEKFVNFPRVPWFETIENGDCNDVYILNIKNDLEGSKFLEEANNLLKDKNITTKSFVFFESFVLNNFGLEIWKEIKIAFATLERELKKYQWFGLTPYYNDLTRENFVKKTKDNIKNINYKLLLNKYNYYLKKTDFDVINNRFKSSKNELLFSNQDYSGSFITSEWLFENFKGKTLLEKTFLVTGYLKSIEQLLTYLIKNNATGKKTIGVNSSHGIIQVDVSSDEFYKATLGNLQFYLKNYNNVDIFESNISSKTIFVINKAIAEWIQKERNGYFHKHNIESFDVVSEIREKTILLYFLILGALK